MALTLEDLITKRARVLLRDTDDGGIQWTDEELISWANEGCSETARLLPESASVTEYMDFEVGTRQRVPAGSLMLLEVLYNASDENTPSRVVRRAERRDLDSERPDWHVAAPANTALRYVPSVTDPRTFHIYPPSDGTNGCILTHVPAPTTMSALTDSFPLPDLYSSLVVNYICFRAWLKLVESPEAPQRVQTYYGLFGEGIRASGGTLEGKNAVMSDPIKPERV